ncbi:DUF3501 family protein [Hydrogenivirga sp. 128-5-R1-1]|uniref:DUF3501 family protein n=1 Tax=Hydrogenivirga sp. 128-5-R1-1 TaxID=392423 RepID=UPI00015EFCFA|nr:DUF3501 family protein [Hydrogenivirga sp. 128-5-R1-1]EDP74522.1 fructose-6-phosphate aldolase 2 [Hydrogenivirga sp. 128-5-R1-1]
MRKVEFKDILNIYEYEKVRPEKVKEITQLKKRRRVHLGDKVTLVFENYDTVWFQIQEMIRIERIVEDKDVQFEIDTYNDLIPEKNQLSATFFIEIPDEKERKATLPKLVGIHDAVYLHIGNKYTIKAEADEKSQMDYEEGKASVVHFLKWTLTPEQVEAFKREPVRIEINHENYKAMTELPPEVKEELIKDLESE